MTKFVRGCVVLLSLVLCGLLSCTVWAEDIPTGLDELLPQEVQMLDELSDGENIVLSNYSLEAALAMLLEAATGPAEEELSSFLGMDREQARELERQTAESLAERGVAEVANAFWFKDDMNISSDYMQLLRDCYDADTFFEPDTQVAYSLINAWCNEKTHGLIDSIVSEDMLLDAISVLCNAVYFESNWTDELSVEEDVVFHGLNEDQTTAFVYGGADAYYENDYAVGFGKLYDGGVLFIGILPKSETTWFSDIDVNGFLESEAFDYPVCMEMPRFQVENICGLSDYLQSNGLESCFVEGNLQRMGSDDIFVSKILQKALINVDEYGTRAAAVTAIEDDKLCAEGFFEEEPKSVTLDRPFFFMLKDTVSGRILFMGKVMNID